MTLLVASIVAAASSVVGVFVASVALGRSRPSLAPQHFTAIVTDNDKLKVTGWFHISTPNASFKSARMIVCVAGKSIWEGKPDGIPVAFSGVSQVQATACMVDPGTETIEVFLEARFSSRPGWADSGSIPVHLRH